MGLQRPERGGCSAMSLLALLFLGSLAGFVQGSQPAGSLNVSSLTINAGDEEESRIVLGNTADAFGIALKSNGDFEIRSGDTPSIAVTAEGDIKVYGKLKSTGAVSIEEKLNFMGVDQWLLTASDDLEAGDADTWSNNTPTTISLTHGVAKQPTLSLITAFFGPTTSTSRRRRWASSCVALLSLRASLRSPLMW